MRVWEEKPVYLNMKHRQRSDEVLIMGDTHTSPPIRKKKRPRPGSMSQPTQRRLFEEIGLTITYFKDRNLGVYGQKKIARIMKAHGSVAAGDLNPLSYRSVIHGLRRARGVKR